MRAMLRSVGLAVPLGILLVAGAVAQEAAPKSRKAGLDWWSLQPLGDVTPPSIPGDDWSKNPVDPFILARLKAAGLSPSVRAEPRTLVRRLHVDLLGLPAESETIRRFEADPSQAAWTALVDELLSSPHYGERWARHWLDIARFGETNGYEYNQPRDDAWHYRDWVIRALNRDLPYDRFVRMQIAGDLIQPGTVDGAAAVGFLVAGPHNNVLGKSEVMKRAVRHQHLEEISGTLAQSILGLTVNCARCHDHKYDPISMKEYYRFVAALDGISHGTRKVPVPRDPADSEERARLARRMAELVSARGGRPPREANVVRTARPVPANGRGKAYRVSFQVAPTVWANAGQATGPADGIEVRLLRKDGSTLARSRVRPGAWADAGKRQRFKPHVFTYTGDGSGAVAIQFSPLVFEGRFGGAIDDLVITDGSGETVFQEAFDRLGSEDRRGHQADTRLPVFHSQGLKSWTASGINAMHAVERAPGNVALQVFSGRHDPSKERGVSAEERAIRKRVMELDRARGGVPVFTAISRDPGVMRILQRGDPSLPGEGVAPGGLSAVTGPAAEFGLGEKASDGERRRMLAEWMTERSNGPFHRAIVNRIWHLHFGTGIVDTPNDLGFSGGRPSHPELLEWLATWFRGKGYSLKALHRLIVTSATYQQSSAAGDDRARSVDRDNRLLWRQNARRVDAETLRDSILAVAGVLNVERFGPGFRDVRVSRVGTAHYYHAIDSRGDAFLRRAIYRWQARGERSALLETFDCPDPSTTTPVRAVTTTPAQALGLWNDAFVLRMADRLATRIGDGPVEIRIARAWRHVLGRDPDEEEGAVATRLVKRHGLAALCRVLLNTNEFVVID